MEPKSSKHRRESNQWVISYLNLRKSVGILGISLPVALFTGFWILDHNCNFPPSISHYFYTNLGTLFTGTLCAVALFLFSYNGPENQDRYASWVASVSALAVAFVPASPFHPNSSCCIRVVLAANSFRNGVHYFFAATLFLTFSYFSLCLFTKTDPEKNPTHRKLIRNKIYRVCGWTILACIFVIGLTSIPSISRLPLVLHFPVLTFVFESLALFAFGFSWLIKGEAFLKDLN